MAERPPESEAYIAPPFEPLPRDVLRGFEHVTVPVGEAINTWPRLKTFAASFGYHVPRNFVTWVTSQRWQNYGLENLASLRAKRGVILVSNHRSFFDMYVAACAVFTHGNFIERLYFPVRSNFFYDKPAGALVNWVMSGYAMWPPMFRDDRKAALNRIGLSQMAYALSTPGGVLGIHPEGTRQKGDDPYVLGPARPGVGHLIEQCHEDTMILPFFTLGLGNDFGRELKLRLQSDPGPDIRMHWGSGIRCQDLRDRSDGPQDMADNLLQIVHDLGQQDRAVVGRARR
ncbi:MAG: lysophospholipid acyltransferase family protein [Candidatus Binatia bacterium]|nr:lysophospholipid acyltransferase family protein [Candidatus Binatia bacterium]